MDEVSIAPVDRTAIRRQRLDKGASRAVSIHAIAANDPRDVGEMLAAIVAAAPNPGLVLAEFTSRLRAAGIVLLEAPK